MDPKNKSVNQRKKMHLLANFWLKYSLKVAKNAFQANQTAGIVISSLFFLIR